MRHFYLLFALITLSHSFAQDIWIQADSLNGPPRANAAAFVANENGYVVSGYDGFNKKRSMVSYDPLQDDWDNEESLGGSTGDGLNRTSAVGFQAYGYGFICMGEGDGWIFSDLWMYDPYNQTWTQMANFSGTARTQAVAFEIDNIAYVGTGKADDFSTFLNDFWSYDYLSNSWQQIANFPGTARIDAVGCRMGGKGYVGLGRDASSLPSDFYEYDPGTDNWTQKASFPGTTRMNATSFGRFPQLFVTTGDDGFNYLDDTWEYNYFGNSWQQVTDFPGGPRSGTISFVVDQRQFVGTGFSNGTYYDDFYEYVFTLQTLSPLQISAQLFPNPSTGQFQLNLSGTLEDISFRFYSANGQECATSLEVKDKSNGAYSFHINGISAGTYYLTIFEKGNLRLTQPITIINE